MANYTFSGDLLDDILFRAGEDTSTGASDFEAAALRYLNRAYHGVWSGGSELDPDINERWWWLRESGYGTVTLKPVIKDGTVSVANGSATATLSTAPRIGGSNEDCDGWYFQVDGDVDVFRVSAHTAGDVTLTLDSIYTAPDDGTATYRLMKLEYTLASDVIYLVGAMYHGENTITSMDEAQMLKEYPLIDITSGVPEHFCMLSERSVRFTHHGGLIQDAAGTGNNVDYMRLTYPYIQEPADLTDSGSEEPLVPRQYRKILADWALYLLLADKDDSKSADAFGLAQRGIKAMQNDHRSRAISMSSGGYGKIYPRQADVQKFILRTASGVYL